MTHTHTPPKKKNEQKVCFGSWFRGDVVVRAPKAQQWECEAGLPVRKQRENRRKWGQAFNLKIFPL